MTPHYFGPRSSPLENETVGRFICNLIWRRPDAVRDYCTMGVFDNGALIGGTIFHNWDAGNGVIELTSASITHSWLTRPVILAMFHLPFGLLNCQLVVLRVSEKNEHMIRIANRFGFTGVHIPRLRGRDEGEIIFTLTDDQWSRHRIHKVKNGG